MSDESDWLRWSYPCPVCGSTEFMVKYHWDEPRAGRVTLEFSCNACGAGGRLTEDKDLVNYPPGGAVEPQRVGYYRQQTCVVCGRVLTGKQRMYCSDRCRKRYARRFTDIRGRKRGHSRTKPP